MVAKEEREEGKAGRRGYQKASCQRLVAGLQRGGPVH